jgi:hypothetical protein
VIERRDIIMKTKSAIKLTVTFISLIVLTIMFTADDSFARRRDRHYAGPRHSHNERVIVKKHVRHTPEWKANRKSFYKRAKYYRPYNRGYNYPRFGKYSRPYKRDYYYPRYGKHYRPYKRGYYYPGRIVRRLPYGYRTAWIGGGPYFVFNGVYYRSAPYGYVVVNRPPETIVVRETPTPVTEYEPASGSVSVTVSTLNVRTGPGLGYSLVSQVEEGSILEVRGKADGWLYVRLTDGQSGWVKSVFTERLEPGSG